MADGSTNLPAVIGQQPTRARERPTYDVVPLRRMFDDSQTLTRDAREESLVDVDYYDGKQWTKAEREALRKRKQPDNVWNYTRIAVNGTLGVIEKGATDPRAYPRNPDDEDSADVASKTLRYIGDYNRFAGIKRDVAQDILVPGTGAAIVQVDEDLKITVEQIRWEEFFYDPRSRRKDLRDARYMGVAKWMYADDVAATYPEAKEEIDAVIDSGSMMPVDETFRDRPRNDTAWIDRRKRRLLVVEIYHRVGNIWQRCVFHGSGALEAGPSPYLDEKGKPSNPIEAMSCYIDRENNRYGLVRDMRGPADEINKRSSKLLALVSMSQIEVADPSAIDVDADIARAEAARPDGVIPYGWRKVSTTDMAAGQTALLQHAVMMMERLGQNPAILGRQGADASGRSQMVRQQAGLTESATVFAGIEDWELRIYRQMWARAKQFWKAPMWIRVTDDAKAADFVGINQPVLGPPQLVQQYDEVTGQTGYAMHQPVLGYQNQLGEMDVDIILDTVPDTANLQQEQFLALVDLARAGIPIPPEILVEASSLPNKRELLERLKAPAEQGPSPVEQLKLEAASAATDKLKSETVLNITSAALNEARADTLIGEAMVEAHMTGLTAGLTAGPGGAAPAPAMPPQMPDGPPQAPQAAPVGPTPAGPNAFAQ